MRTSGNEEAECDRYNKDAGQSLIHLNPSLRARLELNQGAGTRLRRMLPVK
jgi:hypothetical protein